MKSIICLLPFSITCFSQNEVSEYMRKTDSVCKNLSYVISHGQFFTLNKKRKMVVNGGYGIKVYFQNDEQYNSSNNIGKDRHSSIIKSSYNSTIEYSKGKFRILSGELYYQNNILLYTRLEVSQSAKNKKKEIETFCLSMEDIKEGKIPKNLLSFNVQQWLNNTNTEIQEIHKDYTK